MTATVYPQEQVDSILTSKFERHLLPTIVPMFERRWQSVNQFFDSQGIFSLFTSSGLNPPNSDIDNKIEQAMDLVKSHLMMAVREEVEELKLKIQDLMKTITDLTEKNSALEKENRSLRAQATPEPQSATPDAPSLSIQQPSAPSGAVQ